MHKEDNVEIYGEQGCARCLQVKKLIEKRNIPYEYIKIEDLEYPDHIIDLITLNNNDLYPLIMYKGEIVSLKDVLSMRK